MTSVSKLMTFINEEFPDPFAADFTGYADELPTAVQTFEPAPDDSAWLSANPTVHDEPTDADWEEMARWCEHLDRLYELRRDEDARAEIAARYGL